MADEQTTAELVATASQASGEIVQMTQDDDAYWQIIRVLQLRGTQEVFDTCQVMCASESSGDRQLGINILGQLGTPDFPFRAETIPRLLRLLEQEQDPEVIGDIGIAFGHLRSEEAIAPLVRLKSHASQEVRFGVTYGLLCQEDPLAIATLIELSADPAVLVRNWAMFGLGSQIDVDTLEIRQALWSRLEAEKPGLADDDIYEIYGEALVGLARRGDSRILDLLLEELHSNLISPLALEACEELGDERLYPVLLVAQEWLEDSRGLTDAIAACKPKYL